MPDKGTAMIGPFTVLSCLLLFGGGAAVALGYTAVGVALTGLGAGWNGILFATMQRIASDAKAAMPSTASSEARHGGHQ